MIRVRRLVLRTVRAGRERRDDGSAIAEYAMVSGLVLLMFLAAFQVGYALHVRNTLIANAAEGARYGARADAAPTEGAERTRRLIRAGLRDSFAQDVSAQRLTQDGVPIVRVRVVAPLPVLGPFGPSGRLEVAGRAYAESAP